MLSMSFIEELAKYAEDNRGNLSDNEAATKQSLILPLIDELGYNTRDAMEVYPEFTADIGIKQGEKVDYAIRRAGEPIILVECKAINKTLNTDVSQLYRYFTPTRARFGVLTNGVVYRFFSDLKTANVMDQTPFLEVDIRSADEGDVAHLRRFAKDSFDAAKIKEAAVATNILTGVKANIQRMYDNPDDEFSKTLFRNVGVGDLAIRFAANHRELVKRAFHQFVSDRSGMGSGSEFSQTAIAGASQSTPEQASSGAIPSGPLPVEQQTLPTTPAANGEWRPLSDAKAIDKTLKLQEIVFPDGSSVATRNWNELTVEVVRWLTDNNHLTKAHCPIKTPKAKTPCVFAEQPVRPSGEPHPRTTEVNGLWVVDNLRHSWAAGNARTVVKRVGMDSSKFKVRW